MKGMYKIDCSTYMKKVSPLKTKKEEVFIMYRELSIYKQRSPSMIKIFKNLKWLFQEKWIIMIKNKCVKENPPTIIQLIYVNTFEPNHSNLEDCIGNEIQYKY